MLPAAEGPGVYIHVPFCTRRCDYCAFATWTGRESEIQRYIDAVHTEWESRRDELGARFARTIYVGGGTPSLVPGPLLARLLGAIERSADCEVTVECNPESTSEELLGHLASAGVTRISLGVQSTVPHVLAGLGRDHHPGALARAVAAVTAVGFASYSVDLIYGGAGERDEDFARSLADILTLDPPPPHVSAYALTIEAGTPLARAPERHPDDDVQATRYEMADEALAAAGLSWYEISNWARPGHESRHNSACWRQEDYLGLGCAAHSHRAGTRSWNVVNLDRYLRAITAGGRAPAGEERLSPAERQRERLELALRTRAGVPTSAFAPATADELVGAGLLDALGEHLVLTRRGRLLANEITCRLRDAPPAAARTGGRARAS
jgi:oxygen-independent coproporphyrinogen-3 oxidase